MDAFLDDFAEAIKAGAVKRGFARVGTGGTSPRSVIPPAVSTSAYPTEVGNDSRLSHFDSAGEARMVDVGSKNGSSRTAKAHAFVRMSAQVLDALKQNPKGDPLGVARIAGVLAAKKTAELIPLCHSLPLSHADVELKVERDGIRVLATASTTARTGVEMEALTAASVAALTIYDMTKALDKRIEIQDVYLLEKTGGKSGDFRR